MNHLELDSNLKDAIRMDGDISRGPAPRWQRKAREQGILSNENSFSFNKSSLVDDTPSFSKTPKHGKSPGRHISPGRSKSPGRMMPPKLSVRGPGQKTPGKTQAQSLGDRFIPNRSFSDLDRSHHLLMSKEKQVEEKNTDDGEVGDNNSVKQKEYKDGMLSNLNEGGGAAKDERILAFQRAAPQGKGHQNNLKVLYSAGKPSASKATKNRHIPTIPEKVLDAPDLMNDYYLHLLDWSCNNHLSVALGSCVYLWNAGDGSISSLTQYEEPDHVCSVSWIKEGSVLAVGLSNSTTQLWDVGNRKLVRTMDGHSSRVSSLAWNNHILTSGSQSGLVIHHDVRIPDHVTMRLANHTQEVCGLKWSPDGRYLATGGNDNIVNIWEGRSQTPIHTMTEHQAAVRGLAWCPYQHNILATGGGTADRSIKLWNCSLGTCLKTVNTNSQVSSIVWSTNYKEIMTGHGYSHNQLTLWKYPQFTKLEDLTGHTGRVLDLVVSPDGQTVASCAADETLRLWKCWAVEGKSTQKSKKEHPVSALQLERHMR